MDTSRRECQACFELHQDYHRPSTCRAYTAQIAWTKRVMRLLAAERSVLDALKAAGFSWGAGHWIGERAKLPDGLIA